MVELQAVRSAAVYKAGSLLISSDKLVENTERFVVPAEWMHEWCAQDVRPNPRAPALNMVVGPNPGAMLLQRWRIELAAAGPINTSQLLMPENSAGVINAHWRAPQQLCAMIKDATAHHRSHKLSGA